MLAFVFRSYIVFLFVSLKIKPETVSSACQTNIIMDNELIMVEMASVLSPVVYPFTVEKVQQNKKYTQLLKTT